MKDSLLIHAKDFNQKAIHYFINNEMRYFLIDAAVSVELLGKAYLASIHPSLIVANDLDSLLYACGAVQYQQSKYSIRTIGSRDVFKRCSRLISRLRDYRKELEILADLRNGLVHFGEYDSALAGDIMTPYLKYTKTLLDEIGISLEEYFGEFKDFVTESIQDSVDEVKRQVELLLAKSKSDYEMKFAGMDNKTKKAIVEAIEGTYTLSGYDETLVACPACSQLAVAAGGHDVIEWKPDYDKEGNVENAYPIVILFADSLKCSICGLVLDTFEQLEAAEVETSIELEDVDPSDFYEGPPYDDYDYYRDYREL